MEKKITRGQWTEAQLAANKHADKGKLIIQWDAGKGLPSKTRFNRQKQ